MGAAAAAFRRPPSFTTPPPGTSTWRTTQATIRKRWAKGREIGEARDVAGALHRLTPPTLLLSAQRGVHGRLQRARVRPRVRRPHALVREWGGRRARRSRAHAPTPAPPSSLLLGAKPGGPRCSPATTARPPRPRDTPPIGALSAARRQRSTRLPNFGRRGTAGPGPPPTPAPRCRLTRAACRTARFRRRACARRRRRAEEREEGGGGVTRRRERVPLPPSAITHTKRIGTSGGPVLERGGEEEG